MGLSRCWVGGGVCEGVCAGVCPGVCKGVCEGVCKGKGEGACESGFCEERDIVCGAVVGASSISIEFASSLLRFDARDKMVEAAGRGAWRGAGVGLGLAESLCASCAVSWAMRGVERVLVWASWERRAEGFCRVGGGFCRLALFGLLLLVVEEFV